jgi:L-lactate dehydrogenase complex protein LldF
MATKKRNIRKEIKKKLDDDVLRNALRRFAEEYPGAREKALENIENVEELRETIRDMKRNVVAHIEEVADQFVAEATRRGVKVFRAAKGDDVTNYIINLCKEKGIKRIVKSKSMASEEIDLSHHLKAAGMRVKETDLGEWIISIAGHRPSHMILPAIHLNRYQVAEYFANELSEDVEPDIPFMVHRARVNLREEFLRADMGISGANFGIAETGAIGLITNEGNGRLGTTLPRIHVAIIGYEKLIPTFKDVVPLLRLLPRGATAQLMTSYVSMIAGPAPVMVKRGDAWVEEEKEMHIVLLDNGRLEAAHDEKLKEIYQCIRCASCINVCPVYALVGGHVYGGHTYAGGIGAILTALTSGMGAFEQINELCIGCRRCTEVCPGLIDIPSLIEELRKRSVKEHGLPFIMKRVFDVMSNRRLFHSLLRTASVAQKPFKSGTMIRHLPFFLTGLTKDRSLPTIAGVPLRDRLSKVIKKRDNPVKRVGFFSGCTMDFVFPETGENVIKVLQDLNMEVVFPEGQSCCGKPVSATGDVYYTKRIAKQNIDAFEQAGVDDIICACPTGVEQFMEYGELLKDEPDWAERARAMSGKIREFTSFVYEEYKKTGRLKRGEGPHTTKVTYHDSCHLKRVLGIYKEPRALLETLGRYELVEMKDADKCCGMSGAFGVTHSNLSIPILEEKMGNIRDTEADVVACACSGCMMQLQGGVDKQTPGKKMKHIADLLAENIKD